MRNEVVKQYVSGLIGAMQKDIIHLHLELIHMQKEVLH